MDIETLRKIQETEKALRIHNISVSTQEASEAVSRDVYVGGTKVPSFEDVTHGSGERLLKMKEEAYQQKMAQNEGSKMDDKTLYGLKQTLEEQGELITQQAKLIYQLQGVVNDIIKEIKKIQSSTPTRNPAERQQVLKAEDKQQHPRSGGYTSEDVSVEKFFNFSGSR